MPPTPNLPSGKSSNNHSIIHHSINRHPLILILLPLMVLLMCQGERFTESKRTYPRAERVRTTLVERYEQLGLSGRELHTVSALTLGLRKDLDQELKLHFQRAGAAHILAVSGLHTGIVYMIVMSLLTVFGYYKPLHEERWRRILISLTVVALMWGYALLTGMSAPVVRSVVMVTIYEIGVLTRRPSVSLNTLMAAAIVILLVRPWEWHEVGFWLSFSAVAAILIMMPRVPIRNIVGRWWVELLLVSLIAQIGTLPITLHVFGQMSNYFLLTNCIVIPLAYVIVALGLAAQLLYWLPGVGSLLAWLLNGSAWLLNTSVGWIESLPGAVTSLYISTPMMALFYGAIVMGVLSLRHSLYWLLGVFACMCVWCALYISL